MSYLKIPAGAIVGLALAVLLAACGQVSANAPSPAPTVPATPMQSESPSVTPTPSPTPRPTQPPVATPEPTPVPTPTPAAVTDFDLPMVARSTTDGVNVRVVPDLQAPLLVATRYSDGAIVPDVRLAAGQQVIVSMGPVFADGHSWYEVRAVDGGDEYWEFGWVSGQFLERVSELPASSPVVADTHGIGEGGSTSADVIAGTPVTVRFAAGPVDGAASCDIDVRVIRSDGLAVNVETATLVDTRVYSVSPSQQSTLFQEEAGTVRLEVVTDCTFAANMTMPPA